MVCRVPEGHRPPYCPRLGSGITRRHTSLYIGYNNHLSPKSYLLSQYPEDARLLVEQQLRLLSSCAKGLSPAQDTFTYEDPDTPESAARVTDMNTARSDASLAEARQTIVGLLRETMSYWSTDSELSDVCAVPSTVGVLIFSRVPCRP
jgi:hypothetical protein